MSSRQSLFAAASACFVAFAYLPASAQTLRYANQGDLKSLDPYTLNESTTHAHLGHVFEGLVARDKDLKIIPALAESWETPEPTRWRFHLRKGVKFHNGDPFTADDVLFSADRVSAFLLEDEGRHTKHEGEIADGGALARIAGEHLPGAIAGATPVDGRTPRFLL